MSKMKMAGKTPMCVNSKCRSFYSLKKINEVELQTAHETGLCPKCQANAAILAQFLPVQNEVEVKADMTQVLTSEDGVNVVDIELSEADGAVVSKVKPSKRIKEIVSDLVANNQINDAMLNNLLDKQYALKSLGGVKYAFMKEVDTAQDIRMQVMVNGKARYSTKVMEICGRSVVMTNDLYEKNLKAIEKWAEGFDLAKAV